MTDQSPSPSTASKRSSGVSGGGIAALIAVLVGGSTVVLNSLEIKDKVAVKPEASPATVSSDRLNEGPQVKIGGEAGELEMAQSVEPAALPLAAPEVPTGTFIYTDPASVPADLSGYATQFQQVFVALESAARNSTLLNYEFAVIEMAPLRALKKPGKDGVVYALGPQNRCGYVRGFFLDEDRWKALQQSSGDVLLVVGFVRSPEPDLDWARLREELGTRGLAPIGTRWDVEGIVDQVECPPPGSPETLVLIPLPKEP